MTVERRSLAYCDRLARRTARNFYPAFAVLPRPQRLAMCALYAFMRLTDDRADEPGASAAELNDWRQRTAAALAGTFTHPIHPALAAIVRTYNIPPTYLYAVIDGCVQDLTPQHYATFSDLYAYCYRVASVVGLACIHIWGYRGQAALADAEAAGIAFQLTNILRDLGEDLDRERVYLPADELARFGCPPSAWRDPQQRGAFVELMRFQTDRARAYYDQGAALLHRLPPAGRAVFGVMNNTYRGLLDKIVARNFDVFSQRVSLSRWRKLAFVVQALPVRWGWL